MKHDDWLILGFLIFLTINLYTDMTPFLTLVLASLFMVLYAIFDALGDSYMFLERRSNYTRLPMENSLPDYNTLWHRMQALQQALIIIATVVFTGLNWSFAIIAAAIFWITHDGIVNQVGLKQNFFFVGTTGFIDKLFQKTSNPEAWMAVVKLLSLGVGIFLFTYLSTKAGTFR